MFQVVQSTQKKDQLVDSLNFIYQEQKKNSKKTRVYWECIKRKQFCKARLITKSKSENYELLSSVLEHNHASSKDKVEARKAMNEMKEMAQNEYIATRSVIANVVSDIDEQVKAQMPHTSLMARNIRNWRQKHLDAPPIPNARSGFEIPAQYAQFNEGESFLLHDSGIDDLDRILIFATQKGLHDLKKYRNWAGDVTFKVYPDTYYQLYTLHVQDKAFSVPRLFALLPNKKQETYNKLFLALKNIDNDLSALSMMTDFELASMNAFTEEFPNSILSGCLFHFCKNVYKKLCDLGLKSLYHTDKNFCFKVRCLCALAFLPPEDVAEGFEELTDDEVLSSELLSYFEVTYIGVFRGRGANRRRTSPTFPIHIWNMFHRVKENQPRSNNSLEGWHNAFNKSVMNLHPSIWRLIECLKKEENLSQMKLIQHERGEEIVHKKYKNLSTRLYNIVSSYNSDEKMMFLQSVAYSLHIF